MQKVLVVLAKSVAGFGGGACVECGASHNLYYGSRALRFRPPPSRLLGKGVARCIPKLGRAVALPKPHPEPCPRGRRK